MKTGTIKLLAVRLMKLIVGFKNPAHLMHSTIRISEIMPVLDMKLL